MRIVYLHGRMSGPNSQKCKFLRENGHEVYAPRLISHDWGQSVTAAREIMEKVNPDLVIGSSRGGAVAMATNSTVPMVLICPAWGKYAPWSMCRGNSTILHAKEDRIVKFSDSKLLSEASGAKLVEVGKDHRMNDENALHALLKVISEYTSQDIMTFQRNETVFGSRHAKKLKVGDLVSWTEWVWEQTGKMDPDGGEPLYSRQTKCIGVISDLYVEDRDIRKVAMAKVVPMNNKNEKTLREKSILVTSLKIVSSGGFISGKTNNRVISE